MINQVDVLRGHMEHIGGCGDGGCIVHVRPGMHTNGGCRCTRNPHTMFQVVHWHKRAVAEQAVEIERLRALLTRWSDYDEEMGRIMGGIETYERLVADTDAILQPKEADQ